MAVGRRKKNAQTVNPAKARLNSLRSNIDVLQDGVKRLANDVSSAASEGVLGAMSGALQSAQNAVGKVEDWSAENIGEAREAVRSQPLAACVLSLGAGAIIGALLLR